MKTLTFIFPLFFLVSCGFAQTNTIGVLQYDQIQTYNGYSLLFPTTATDTYLIDNCGREVHKWFGDKQPGQVAFLLDNGNLVRTYTSNTPNANFKQAGASDGVQTLDWDNNVLWDYTYSNSDYRMHHDIAYLPNGNVLILAWEKKSITDMTNAGINLSKIGATQNDLWPEHIVEIQPTGLNTGNIVWQWHVWDHLIQDYSSSKSNYGNVAKHPELVDINYSIGTSDFLHINAIDYNADKDQIILSVHNFNEVWIIDHSTTTTQAAGHSGGNRLKGGDILYRWGNPAAYKKGNSSNQKFYGQHDAHWIPQGLPDEGKIMIFNNGNNRPAGKYSSVEIINPPTDVNGNYKFNISTLYGPLTQEWIYTANPAKSLYSSNISGAQRLANGNTLMCSGANGTITEVTATNEIVWKYIIPLANGVALTQGQSPLINGKYENMAFRCYKYGEDFLGFVGKTLTAGNYLELNPDSSICDGIVAIIATDINDHETKDEVKIYPNPTNDFLNVQLNKNTDGLYIVNSIGQTVYTNYNSSNMYSIDIRSLNRGIYFIKCLNSAAVKKIYVK